MYWVKVPSFTSYLFPEWKWKVEKHQIALTFDDGPDASSTPKLLEILEKENCPATFFLLGKQVVQYPELLFQLQSSIHALGHHSFSHLNGWSAQNEEYVKDMIQGFNEVKTPLFRPPYGKITPVQWDLLKEQYPDWNCCLFNFMPGDFDEKVNEWQLKERMYQVKGGEIIVLHDRPDTLLKFESFLPQWIKDMRDRGLEFVTL